MILPERAQGAAKEPGQHDEISPHMTTPAGRGCPREIEECKVTNMNGSECALIFESINPIFSDNLLSHPHKFTERVVN